MIIVWEERTLLAPPTLNLGFLAHFWVSGTNGDLENDVVSFLVYCICALTAVAHQRRPRTTEKAMGTKSLDSLRPTETLEIENGLTLVPRVMLNLTIFPSETASVTKPIDEWQLKRALIDFLKTSFHVPITVPEEDLHIKRFKDLKKRKRVDPVAGGTIFIRDLGFLNNKNEDDLEVLDKKFLDWKSLLVEKMDGIELNLEGVKFRLGVAIPATDDFQGMKKDWEDFYAFGNRGL